MASYGALKVGQNSEISLCGLAHFDSIALTIGRRYQAKTLTNRMYVKLSMQWYALFVLVSSELGEVLSICFAKICSFEARRDRISSAVRIRPERRSNQPEHSCRGECRDAQHCTQSNDSRVTRNNHCR